jgi:phosphoesterase RecJ-like protein
MDHHATNPGFGELMVLDGRAAAVGEMAVSLIEAMGVRLSREMAECLFVAISTDCGQFSYSNTRRETFEAAGKCGEAGIDLAGITEALYRTRTLSRTRLLARVLSGIEISEDGRMAWARLTEAMLRECGATWEENEGIVNYLREIEGVEFGMLVEQRGDKTKLSMRSGKRLDVANAVAAPLGGGGRDGSLHGRGARPHQGTYRRLLLLLLLSLHRRGRRCEPGRRHERPFRHRQPLSQGQGTPALGLAGGSGRSALHAQRFVRPLPFATSHRRERRGPRREPQRRAYHR